MDQYQIILEKQKKYQVFSLRHLLPEQIVYSTGISLSEVVNFLKEKQSPAPLSINERQLFDNNVYFNPHKKEIKKRLQTIQDISNIIALGGDDNELDNYCERRNISLKELKEALSVIKTLDLVNAAKKSMQDAENESQDESQDESQNESQDELKEPTLEQQVQKPQVKLQRNQNKVKREAQNENQNEVKTGFGNKQDKKVEPVEPIEPPKEVVALAKKEVNKTMRKRNHNANRDRSLKDEFGVLINSLDQDSFVLARTFSLKERPDSLSRIKSLNMFSKYFTSTLMRNYYEYFSGKMSKKIEFFDKENQCYNYLIVDIFFFKKKNHHFDSEFEMFYNYWKKVSGDPSNLFVVKDRLRDFYQAITVSQHKLVGLGEPLPKKGNVGPLYCSIKFDIKNPPVAEDIQEFNIAINSNKTFDKKSYSQRKVLRLEDAVRDFVKQNYQKPTAEAIEQVKKKFKIKTVERVRNILGIPNVDNIYLANLKRRYYQLLILEKGLKNKPLNEVCYELNLSQHFVKNFLTSDFVDGTFIPEPFNQEEQLIFETHSNFKEIHDKKHESKEFESIDKLLEPYLGIFPSKVPLEKLAKETNKSIFFLKKRMIILRTIKGISLPKMSIPKKELTELNQSVNEHLRDLRKWVGQAEKMNLTGFVEICNKSIELITKMRQKGKLSSNEVTDLFDA